MWIKCGLWHWTHTTYSLCCVFLSFSFRNAVEQRVRVCFVVPFAKMKCVHIKRIYAIKISQKEILLSKRNENGYTVVHCFSIWHIRKRISIWIRCGIGIEQPGCWLLCNADLSTIKVHIIRTTARWWWYVRQTCLLFKWLSSKLKFEFICFDQTLNIHAIKLGCENEKDFNLTIQTANAKNQSTSDNGHEMKKFWARMVSNEENCYCVNKPGTAFAASIFLVLWFSIRLASIGCFWDIA